MLVSCAGLSSLRSHHTLALPSSLLVRTRHSVISQAPGKIQATIYLALPISHKQAGTPGHPTSQRMRTRSTGVQTTPTVIGRLDHQPKCRASLRDLKFSWVLSQEQEKILPYLQFTIIYLGVSTTRSLPKPDSPWGVGVGTHGPSASPPSLPGVSGQQRRPPIFLSVWQEPPCCQGFLGPTDVLPFLLRAVQLSLLARCLQEKGCWGNDTQEVLPQMSSHCS